MKKLNLFKNNGSLAMTAMLTVSLSLMSFIVYDRYDLNLLVADDAFKTPEKISDRTNSRFFTVNGVVTAAQNFKTTLSTTQISTLQKSYTTTLARKWSNLPCGSGCRNGIQFSTLSTTQLAAAKAVIQAALGTASNNGYDLFNQILLADDYLNANGGGSGYGSGIYFISFLNEPSTTGAWMLQFGGHHMAFNIAFNGGKVVGTTPVMLGVEPTSFTANNTTITALSNKRLALQTMLGSFTTAQLATAKLTTTFNDCLMSPGEANGNTNTMPTTKQGILYTALSSTSQANVLTAIQTWTADMDSETQTALNTLYANGLSGTYIAWTGSGTSGTPSSFLSANSNYVRIDGPRVWIEFICQNGAVYQSQIHYHSVWRDHQSDYGNDLSNTALGTVEISGNSVNLVKIYPNPTSETLNIQVEKNLVNASVVIFDASGRNVASAKKVSGKTVNIPVGHLKTGNYVITVADAYNQNFTAKFIKK